MRDVKKRYFYEPPLVEADFIALGLKPKDAVPTFIGRPTGIPLLSAEYDRTGRIIIQIKVVEGQQTDERTNYGCQMYYAVYAAGDPLPASGDELRNHRFTRQKKMSFSFAPADRGKTAFFCARCENSKGDAGDWGAMISALIP